MRQEVDMRNTGIVLVGIILLSFNARADTMDLLNQYKAWEAIKPQEREFRYIRPEPKEFGFDHQWGINQELYNQNWILRKQYRERWR